MLINFKEAVKKHGLHIKGVIQAGSHWGEEVSDYIALGVKNMVLIEPSKKAFAILKEKFSDNKDIKLFNCAVGAKTGMVFMHTEEKNNGQSNSLLKPLLHLQQFPDIVFNGQERVELRPLDSLFIDARKYNTLVMDVQGYEGEVLKGGRNILKGVDIVYTEVNRAEVYQGCVKIEELDYMLSDFERVETDWGGDTWGDALYVRKVKEVTPPAYENNIVDVPKMFLPADTDPYPEDNTPDFEQWFCENYSGDSVRRIYLPVMWTSYYRKHNYGRDPYAIELLQKFLDTLDAKQKYFTIVQYDDGILNDLSKLSIQVFSMSGQAGAYPLPLICQPHPFKLNNKRDIFCSFVGRNTHPIRKKVMEQAGKHGYYISTVGHSLMEYCKILSRSTFVLCPRGYGINSFRIMEAVQYGAIPVYISDKFTLPHDHFHYGVLIPETEIENMHERLSSMPKEIVQHKRGLLKNVFFNYFSFEANRRLIFQHIK